MAYRYSSLAGRLQASSKFAAYRPQGFQAAPVVSSPPVFSSKTIQSIRDTQGARHVSSSEVEKAHPTLLSEEELSPEYKTILHAHETDYIFRSFGRDVATARLTQFLTAAAIAFILYTTHKIYNPDAHKK